MRAAVRERRGGQAILIVTFSLTFLFAAMGLSVDLGWAYYLKLRVQTAADAAATAAAVYAQANGDSCSSISCGTTYTCVGTTPPTTSLQAGCLYATTDGPPSFTATMLENNTVPPGITGNTPSLWIRATVSTTAPNFFLFGQGYTISSISAQATSGVTTLPNSSCIYVLNANASGAFQVTGTSTLTTSGCGTYVNSSSTTGTQLTGSAHIAGPVQLVASTYSQGSSTGISPAPTYNASAATDPLASLAAPVFSGCNQTGFSMNHTDVVTLSPGVYCGGISIIGSAHATFSPGTYILNGNGLTISNSAVVTGSGVTFYNTATGSNSIAPINITGAATVNLSAPTSGPLQGVVFFQDRNLPYTSANTISNSATGSITGVYYFPKSTFSFTGNTTTATYAAFIADKVTINGSSTLQNDTTGTFTGLAKTKTTLIQ